MRVRGTGSNVGSTRVPDTENPSTSQAPQGKQYPNGNNREAGHSYPTNVGTEHRSWDTFKKWPCKGPGEGTKSPD